VRYDASDDPVSEDSGRNDKRTPLSGEEMLLRVIDRRTDGRAIANVSAETRAELHGFAQGLLAFGHIKLRDADRLLEPFFGPNYVSSQTTTVRIEPGSELASGGAVGGRQPGAPDDA
jgi:hypothetical protein